MTNVVDLSNYRGKDIVMVCEEIIGLVREGNCQGVGFMISENGKHRIGITGTYKEEMALVCDLAAAFIDENHPNNKAFKNG